MIIGVDYHPSFQQIASLVEATGECGERRLNHSDGEAENFYRDLKARGISVRVGLETTAYSRWFERLLAELGFGVWIGDAAGSRPNEPRSKDGPPGCATLAEAPVRRTLSTDLGALSGKLGSAATAVASASAGADADTDHESAASAGDEREQVLEGKTVE